MSIDNLLDTLTNSNRERQQNFMRESALRSLIPQMIQQVRSEKDINNLGPNHSGLVHQASGGPLQAVFQNALQKLVADSGGKVRLGALSRSYDEQVRLWNQAVKKYGANANKWAAKPGGSKHGVGLANDLKYADAATRAWVHQNARNYGLWFPMAHEPWHIEPLGSR